MSSGASPGVKSGQTTAKPGMGFVQSDTPYSVGLTENMKESAYMRESAAHGEKIVLVDSGTAMTSKEKGELSPETPYTAGALAPRPLRDHNDFFRVAQIKQERSEVSMIDEQIKEESVSRSEGTAHIGAPNDATA